MSERIQINRKVYRDKVFGCWFGKSIGGTLGAPYEGQRVMNNVRFYPESISGVGLPNDDLDLQLAWLHAVEMYGAENINERILAEYWSEFVTGPWSEYGVCRNNIRLGLMPPLSGSVGNDIMKWSNGAWIRSELWACLFPGKPEFAARGAYCDACCDHTGEGVYAEIFTAAMESLAFIESDLHKLIAGALKFLPQDSRVARAVRIAEKCYVEKKTLAEAREAIVQDSTDLGWFQAPGNIAFAVLGLLYGEGDFGNTVCYAVNCGDDTDCTGGTAAAVLGIILGANKIPARWKEPIGETIKTCSIENAGRMCVNGVPADLTELTDRVVACAEAQAFLDPRVMQFTDGASTPIADAAPTEEQIYFLHDFLSKKHPYELTFDLPVGTVSFDFYENGPYIEEGKPLKFIVRAYDKNTECITYDFRFKVPEGWSARNFIMTPRLTSYNLGEITPGAISDPIVYLPVEIRKANRLAPFTVNLPLIHKGCTHLLDLVTKDDIYTSCRYDFFDNTSRIQAFQAQFKTK